MKYEIINTLLYILIIVLLSVLGVDYLIEGKFYELLNASSWLIFSLGLIMLSIGVSINGGIAFLLTCITTMISLRVPGFYTFLTASILSLFMYKFKASRLINIPLHKPLYKYLVILITTGFSIVYILLVMATQYNITTISISLAAGLVTAFFTHTFYPNIATVLYTFYLYIYYQPIKSNTIHIHRFSNMARRYKDNMLITPYIASISMTQNSKAEDLNISAVAYYFLKQGLPLMITKYKTDGKGNYVFY